TFEPGRRPRSIRRTEERRYIDRIATSGAPRPRGRTDTAAGRSGSRREEPPSETKFSDTLVEILGEAASDAGSTPAASTKPNLVLNTIGPHRTARLTPKPHQFGGQLWGSDFAGSLSS